MRQEFHDIVTGWMLIDGMQDISDRIERVGKWTEANGPLEPDEEATVKMMIESQIARGIDRGDFAPYIVAECRHERLDEDGICRRCGHDCRGIG